MPRNFVVPACWLFTLAFVGAFSVGGSAQSANSPLAQRLHPRLLITADSLGTVKARLGSGGVWSSDFQAWVTWADAEYGAATTRGNTELLSLAADYAFLWLTHPVAGANYGRSRADYGAKARELLLMLPTRWPTAPTYEGWGAPLAYDWIAPLLSAGEKQTVVAWFKTAQLPSDSSPFNSQVAVARGALLMSALASLGDGADDSWAQSQVDKYAEYFTSTTGVTRSESDLVGEDGGAAQGDSYGLSYTAPAVLMAEEAWRTANGIAAGSHYLTPGRSFLRRLPVHVSYTILPWAIPDASKPGGRRYLLWKSQYAYANKIASEGIYRAWLTALAGVLESADPEMAGLAQWLLDNRVGNVAQDAPSHTKYALWKFALGNRVSPRSPEQLNLPLSRRFRDGRFVFRTGWSQPNDSYVTINFNEWLRAAWGFSPNYPGGFTIDRNGPQVIRQGGVSGHDWGSSGAGPANVLVFPDRSIQARTGNYDDAGGSRNLPGPMRGSVDFVQNGLNDQLDEVRFLPADPGGGRDLDYVSGDITRAYSSTRIKDDYNPARISSYVRQFVYLRPTRPGIDSDRVIVFDRVTATDTKFEKNWLFHTSTEPTVNGIEAVGVPVRNGSGAGKRSYSGATLITASNTLHGSNGKTFLTPLLPSARVVVKVGGPNAAGQSWQQDSHEFEDSYGVITPRYAAPSSETEPYVGQYRVEVIPAVPALSETFLNVIEVGEAALQAPAPTTLVNGTAFVGARVADRIVMFGRAGNAISGGEFLADAAGTFRVHIADLVPYGEYDVTVGAATTRRVASSAGTLYFEATLGLGTRVALQGTGTVLYNPPRAPSNVRITGY